MSIKLSSSLADFISSTQQSNLEWIKNVAPSLESWLPSYPFSNLIFEEFDKSSNKFNLLIDGELQLADVNESLFASLSGQLSKTDGISVPRVYNEQVKISGSNNPAYEILSKMVNSHNPILLEYLPCIDDKASKITKPNYRNLVVFGSLMLVPLMTYIQSNECPWASITLVEDTPDQLAATLSLLDFSSFINLLREKQIGLTLHIESSASNIQDRLYTQVAQANPTLMYGWQTLRSPMRSPALMEVHSWLHAEEGSAEHFISTLGFLTDEINQAQQALWNALTYKDFNVLKKVELADECPVVLVASGPSLEEHLAWLRDNQDSLNIVAAGSSLGVLVRSGIKPSAATFLERDADVYNDIAELLLEGFSLKDISVFVSSTVDPRIPKLFGKSIFFHRPVSAACSFFPGDQSAVLQICGPQVAVPALEALIALGVDKVMLIGLDFASKSRTSPRAKNALGETPRNLVIPMLGNYNKTVFSEPGLIHTASLFDRIVGAYPFQGVLRLGEGINMDNVENITMDDSEKVQAFFTSTKLMDVLSKCSKTSFSASKASELLIDLHREAELMHEFLADAISSSTTWNNKLSLAVSKYVARLNNEQHSQKMLINLVSQPIFRAASTLHDSNITNTSWNDASCKFLESVLLLKNLIQDWSNFMRTILELESVPEWDLQIIRQRYLYLANQSK